ncbi:MAG: alpha/beta hydrolase [Candidatus Riflebacteria bacterium]|nr:alpha/beta hydrolase [Candidatus Riflebacteria bacterium]
MPTFALREGPLHYLDVGAGPPLVLLHGWPVSSVYWRLNLPGLSEHFRVLAVDLPGFGCSFAPAAGSAIPDQARRIAEFLVGLGVGPASVLGHSMGGMIGARLAASEPALVHKLVLLAAALEGPTALSPLGMMGRFGWCRLVASWLLRRRSLMRAAAPWFAHACDVPEEILEVAGQGQPACVRSALASLTHDCRREDLQTVVCPTLVLAADRDRVVHPLQALLARGWIRDSRVQVFRDCGHCPNLEYPALFEEWVVRFLTGA